jgi:DNA-binding MarR family transcriptional regulator
MSSNPGQAIIKGLMKQMKPIQALVMHAVYRQFPERFIPRNSGFFSPSVIQIQREMKLKESVIHLMLARLVDSGYLERRKARAGGLEYRIVFDKLSDFVEVEK